MEFVYTILMIDNRKSVVNQWNFFFVIFVAVI